jgi:hypothetical protein
VKILSTLNQYRSSPMRTCTDKYRVVEKASYGYDRVVKIDDFSFSLCRDHVK